EQRMEGEPSRAPVCRATFNDSDFSADHVAQLRAEMRQSLISAGLFEDEADAMLNTWQRSYFQGVGQRLFFVAPREWTDQVLPLKFSVPVELTRVMIGRIEMITPQQHQAIAKLSTDPKAYQSLGRFGYAMVLDELRRHPTAPLSKFARDNGIRAFTPPAATQPLARADITRDPVAPAQRVADAKSQISD